MSDAYRFHVTLHACESSAVPRESISLHSHNYQRLIVDPAELSLPMNITFEDALAALEGLPQLFVEPDGSFVWVSPTGESPRWQVDGMLYDRDGRLFYVELKGHCSPTSFDQLLRCLGWPAQSLAMQLQREAVLLDEAEFRRFAWPEHVA